MKTTNVEEKTDFNTITRKLESLLNSNKMMMRSLKQKTINDDIVTNNVESNDKQKLTNEASESFKVS